MAHYSRVKGGRDIQTTDVRRGQSLVGIHLIRGERDLGGQVVNEGPPGSCPGSIDHAPLTACDKAPLASGEPTLYFRGIGLGAQRDILVQLGISEEVDHNWQTGGHLCDRFVEGTFKQHHPPVYRLAQNFEPETPEALLV